MLSLSHRRILQLFLLVMAILCFGLACRYGPKAFPPEARRQHIIDRTSAYLTAENDELNEAQARAISEVVYRESEEYDLDYRFVLAVMKVESNFRLNAVSSRGARGLLQVKPSLAKYIAEDVGIQWRGAKTLDEPEKNIRIGVHLLSGLLERFETTVVALHAYNVGPTRLRQKAGDKNKSPRGFSKIVLSEFDRNLSALPDP
jgi:soluble lytic murein transglycosylase